MSESNRYSSEDEQFALVQFLKTIDLKELCVVASSHRDNIPCSLASHIMGGYNVVLQLLFSDGISWLARIPNPDSCFQPDEISDSYAATLKYLKKHSNIPVPEVYAYAAKSAPDNKVKAAYILMEYLSGHPLPTLKGKTLKASDKEIAVVKKVHTQLTDIILELASLKFDKIGSLLEDSNGNFFIGPYTETNATAYPQHKAVAYSQLDAQHKGPFSSTTDWYNAMAELNLKYAVGNPEVGDRSKEVASYELFAELAGHFIVPEFKDGPFVINHNDLTVQNILVDDDFNITGILDFPGTVVPLPSLCLYPWLFGDKVSGLVTDRARFLETFLARECRFQSSSLRCRNLRKDLMNTAESRRQFEMGLMEPYTYLFLQTLYEEIYGCPFEPEVEYKRVVETRGLFDTLVPRGEDGLHSWERCD